MIAVAHGSEPEPRVEGLGGDGRGDSQQSDVSLTRDALDLSHQKRADPLGLNVGSHEDGVHDASIKACRADDPVANGSNKDRTLAEQLQNGIGTEAAHDPLR